MKSAPYFQNPTRTREALARYAHFASDKGWPISEKLALYRHAVAAFGGTADERTRRASHAEVYWNLRSYWKIGRKGALLEAPAIFDLLTGQCQPCSRRSGLTLATLNSEQAQRVVVDCLERLRTLKQLPTGKYPVMAVSKSGHFFNQRLLVIYDNEIIGGWVYPVFKSDWCRFYDSIAADPGDGGISFYLAYLLWASHMIRNAYDGFMGDFADWFIQAVQGEGENAEGFRDELRLSFATAFEFIVIGAAHLEGGSLPCLCG